MRKAEMTKTDRFEALMEWTRTASPERMASLMKKKQRAKSNWNCSSLSSHG